MSENNIIDNPPVDTKDENEVIKINMTNNMIVKVPDTGNVSFSFIFKVCLIFLAVSLVMVIYYVKKY